MHKLVQYIEILEYYLAIKKNRHISWMNLRINVGNIFFHVMRVYKVSLLTSDCKNSETSAFWYCSRGVGEGTCLQIDSAFCLGAISVLW